MNSSPVPRLTDLRLRSLIGGQRVREHVVADGSVPGLSARISRRNLVTWSLQLRVVGEGGINEHGKRLLGRKIRISLGTYPETSIHAARARAHEVLDAARRGVNPKHRLAADARVGGLTVQALSEAFMQEHGKRSARGVFP